MEAGDVPFASFEDLKDPEAEAEAEAEPETRNAGTDDHVKKWHEKWKATVAELKKPVKIVPIIFVEPMPSKKASITLKAIQRIYTRIRLLNLGVRRIHTDSGREFANQLLEGWALSRDIAVTASVPSDPRSNGRVESVVGACKAGVRGLLNQSGLPRCCWPHCASPRKRPLVPSGTTVVVRKREWSMKNPWASKTLQGTGSSSLL